MSLYLYRVLECDDEGDPLDFGILRAQDPEAALSMVAERLESLGLEGTWAVRLYPTADKGMGVFDPAGDFIDRQVTIA